MTPWFFPAIALFVGLIAAITDMRCGRIPNQLTFSAMLMGVAGHSLTHGFAGCVGSLLGAVVCAAVPGIVYKVSQGRGIGGGDIKLFAAIGALLGASQGLEVELSSFLLLGAFALFRLAFIGQLGRTIVRSLRVTAGLFVRQWRNNASAQDAAMTSMRMGPAILMAIATVLSLPFITRWLPWLG